MGSLYHRSQEHGYHKNPGPEGPPGRGHQLRPQRGQDPGARPHRPPQLRPRPGVPPDAGHQAGLWQGRWCAVLSHHPVLQAGRDYPGTGAGDRHRVCKRASAGIRDGDWGPCGQGAYPRPPGLQLCERRHRGEVPQQRPELLPADPGHLGPTVPGAWAVRHHGG